MAEHAGAELVRRGYDAFNSGDMDTLTQIMADDVVWHVSGRNQFSGDKKGRDATFEYFGKLVEITEGTFKAEPHDVVASDGHVVGIQRNKATRKGKTLDVGVALIFHVEDGKVVEVWEAPTDQHAVDQFFS